MLFENADFFGIWIISTTIIVCFIIAILSCVCGCRKKVPKNELLGLAGLVKITNPDENVNFNTPPDIQLNSIEVFSDGELNTENHEVNKRGNNTVATATRSLPDLPVDSGDASEKLWSNAENNADTNSDLYATVEDANRKKRALTSGLTVDSSYTPSQTDDSLSPYARLKGEHSYDQLQQNEHPYAQVGSNGNPLPGTSQESTVNSTPSSHRTGERERNEDERSKSPSLHEPVEEIPAASAIAGSVPANHDLPYMTPPIPQQHFSGDSQDSGKGYTSISVREPLARILAARRGDRDPHYATVSDDSDEMYAAIEERNTSGSETYAQISPPTVLPLVLQHQQSVDGRSISSDESPRRERRPANSPLPEPPSGIVDDMYAKVVKKRSPDHTPTEPDEPSQQPQACTSDEAPLAGYETLADPNYEELQDHDYASLSRRYETVEVDPNYESVEAAEPPYERVEAPDYEIVLRQGGEELDIPQSVLELYAQVNKSPDKSDKL